MCFNDDLNSTFGGYAPNTSRLYIKWCKRLIVAVKNETGEWVKPEAITQSQVDQFLADLVRPGEYSRSATNQAKRAIKLFMASVDNPIAVQMVSVRGNQRIPDILSEEESAVVIANLAPIYRAIAEDVYALTPPSEACVKYYSRGGTVRIETLTAKLKLSAENCGIAKGCGSQSLWQSGIVNAIRHGIGRDELMSKTGRTLHTIARYYRLA